MYLVLLQWLNELLNATVVIVVFSLFAYLIAHNWRNGAARALCVLLISVVIVYGGDILVARAVRPDTIQFLLRAQWLGIGLVPAAYLHLGLSLWPRRPGITSRRHWLIWGGYLGSALFFGLALNTDLIVQGGIPDSVVNQVQAGPLFAVYVLWLAVSMLLLLRAILQARRQALTPGQRRRMSYLAFTFMAPGLGVFPYLTLATSIAPGAWQGLILLLAAVVSVGVMGMLTVMTYSIAFQVIALPDRLIKYDFTRWGLYGPLVGVTIILLLQVVPALEMLIGLPADTLITFVVMLMTVLMPLLISRVRPLLDTLVHKQDQNEIAYLRSLPRQTFTRADLRQLLENTLIAVCGALGIQTGFVLVAGSTNATLGATTGDRQRIEAFLQQHKGEAILTRLAHTPTHKEGLLVAYDTSWESDGIRLLPLHSPDGQFLGALGLELHAKIIHDTTDQNGHFTPEVIHLIDALTHQIELALTTVEIQEQLLTMLRGLGPEMQSLQQLTSHLEQTNTETLSDALPLSTPDPASREQFTQWVKDALTHYWGGPKLSDSPLLSLHAVRLVLHEHSGSPTRALQAVLRQAINNLRPDEQLDPNAPEWTLYNILELRYLQGKRTRDVANRLSMSESDFYRKQRIAVEEVARQLALIEEQHQAG